MYVRGRGGGGGSSVDLLVLLVDTWLLLMFSSVIYSFLLGRVGLCYQFTPTAVVTPTTYRLKCYFLLLLFILSYVSRIIVV